MGRRLVRVGVRALTACTVAAALAIAGAASPALAHNPLTGSSPANGATVARAPATVRLTFLSRLDPATTKISVSGPDGTPAAGGAPAYARNRVTVPFRPGPAGRYTIEYQVASSDGHPVKGRVRFTLTAGVTPTVPPTPTAAAPTTTPAPAPTGDAPGSPAALDPAADEEDSGGALGWVLGALALMLLLGAGAFLLRRRVRA